MVGLDFQQRETKNMLNKIKGRKILPFFIFISNNNGVLMKKILFILFLLPLVGFSQISSWRSNPPSARPSGPSVMGQRSDMSMWRNQSPREFNRPQQTRPGSNIIIHDPWFYNNWAWGWNRWNMWGAPTFGWNYWTPTWYWNDWGYRQPARVYIYEDGKRDTIRGKKPIINFGIQQTTNKEIGGFFTIGNKGYFIAEYNSTFERDNSTFFPYGTITQVDFPLVNDLVKRQSFYIGVGKRIKRTGVHMMVGGVNEIVRWRGKDAVGYITFPKYIDRFTAVKIGMIHDYKNFTTKLDYNPTVKNWTFGLGVNF